MSDSNNIKYSDIKTKGSDFSFTGKLANYAKNDVWVESYKDSIGEESSNNSLSTMWKTINVGSEEVGNEIYKTILNYVNNVGNIDTCGIDRLKEYEKILGSGNELLNSNIKFPLEIKNLIDIFSINRAYLYNKATDGSEDTLILTNSVLHHSTVEQLLESLGDATKYKELIHNCIYNTLVDFINLKNVTFTDTSHGINTTEIWKTDINRFTNKLWSDEVESDDEIYTLKNTLSIDKSFTEKIYADDIIAGERSLNDFSDTEQIVLKAEIEKRKTRYNDANSMKYYYVRLMKVLEYFRFCETVYNNVYELNNYDLDANKYTIKTESTNNSILTYNYDSYSLNTALIRKVAEWITDFTLNISKIRTNLKSQCHRNTMTGTKRLLIDLIRKFILDNIDNDIWNTMKNSILKKSELNKNFDVDIIQYIDTTDYNNIENENDVVSHTEYSLKPRFWENYNDLNNAISNDEILKFFNRISDDGKKFKYNRCDGNETDVNLYEFLSVLFETGATNSTMLDYNLSSDTYVTQDGSILSKESSKTITDTEREVIAKYSGDTNIGSAPYANIKNSYHPSYQVMPFIQAFEEYNEIYSNIVNLVSAYTENIKESVANLSKRLNEFGHTINFWYSWNDDFTGYTTTAEKNSNPALFNTYIDSPFNFDALNELIRSKEDYISNILAKLNKYYINQSTDDFMLNDDEINLEVSRIQKYYDRIIALKHKEIYKYGKDYNGNIYILYKDEGHRNDLNSMGEVWIRLHNHPLAYPLFDIASAPNCFNTTSCLNETDNQKLIEVLNRIKSHFESSYGRHTNEKNVDDGDIIPYNISLTYGTFEDRKPVLTTTRGLSSAPSFDVTYEDFNIDGNPKLTLVHSSNAELNGIVDRMAYRNVYDASSFEGVKTVSEYFIDSVTNEVLNSSIGSPIEVYSEDESGELITVDNSVGKILNTPDKSYFHCDYDNDNKTFEINSNNGVVNNELFFAEYTDENITEDGIVYYCKDTTLTDNELHPCIKKRITIKKLFKLESEALSGYVDKDGNVHFGGDSVVADKETTQTPYSTYNEFIDKVAETVSVDGGLVYEDFNTYRYFVKDGDNTVEVDRSSIVLLGGCNPYHVYYDDNGKVHLREAIINDSQILEANAYRFSDNVFRTGVMSQVTSSFPLSDCRIKKSYEDKYSDTFGSFALLENPYINYYPYTKIDGEPFTNPNGGNGNPKGSITIRDRNNVDTTFYYNLSTWNVNDVPHCIYVKELKYDRYFKSVNVTSTKFNGKFELTPKSFSEYPIYLTFNSDTSDNIATYSTYAMLQDQRKFFDMGFSYNQKMFYLSYYNDTNNYIDGGTLFGKFIESEDEKYNTKLSFFRDSSHNLEYIDPSYINITDKASASEVFHIGDCSTKDGIITAYGRYYSINEGRQEPITGRSVGGKKYVELLMNMITDNNVYEYKFNIPLRYGLYEFSDGKGKFSSKLNCTDSRAYVSFVTETPADNDTLSNTIDESSIGTSGTSRFDQIKSSCSDSTITVFSFDINDIKNILFKEDETRFLMSAGEIGYFSQFAGINGKNNIFANEKLSADTEFTFELKMDAMELGSTNIEFVKDMTSKIASHTSQDVSQPIGKFINIYSNRTNSDTISGIVLSESNEYGYVSTVSEEGGRGIKFSNFDGKKIYDISRGLKSNVMIFADGDDTDTRVGAFYHNTNADKPIDINGLRMVKVPVQTSLSGYYNTDFIDFDESSDSLYAFCSDNKTISEISIDDRGSAYIPLSSISVLDYISNAVVETIDDLNNSFEVGYVVEVKDCKGQYPNNSKFIKTEKGWELKKVSELDVDEIIASASVEERVVRDGYENCCLKGHTKSFALKNDNLYTLFGVYDKKIISANINTVKPNEFEYRPIPFFIDTVPYVAQYSHIVKAGEITRVVYSVVRVNEQGTFTDVKTDNGELHTIILDYSDPIKGIVNTTDSNKKVLYTDKGGVYSYEFKKNGLELAATFNELYDEWNIKDYNLDVSIYECNTDILISFYSKERDRGGLLNARKHTATSVPFKTKVYDINGNLMNSVKIVKALSINDIILIQDEVTGLVYISNNKDSTQDALEFHVLEESVDYKMNLVGCGTNRFYARYENNEKAYSTDGIIWKNEIRVPFSDWCVFNASNVDYIACEKIDDNIIKGNIEKSKYVNVVSQHTLDGEYDGMKCKDRTIVCYGGLDGKSALRISRAKSINDEFETFEFKYSKGYVYNKVSRYGNDLMLPPDGSSYVVVIKNAFNFDAVPYVQYIDISKATNNSVDSFGGFAVVCDRLIMYPIHGDRLLCYNENTSTFYNFFSFGSSMSLADVDTINGYDSSDAIITSRYIESDGSLKFYKTSFIDRTNYGIFEIDEGFPILVTYSKYKTEFTYGGKPYDVYSMTFTYINDASRRSVTIISRPELDDVDISAQHIVDEESSKAALYISENQSVCYRFSSVDNYLRFKVEKIFKNKEVRNQDSDYLTVSFAMQSLADRNRVSLDYELAGDKVGAISVYKNFDNKQFNLYLKPINLETASVFVVHINEEDLKGGFASFNLRVWFDTRSNNDECTISWGDGEISDEVITSYDTDYITDSRIVKDGLQHVYQHHYYSTGDFVISVGDGAKQFCTGSSIEDSVSKSFVTQVKQYSNSVYLTSANYTFKACKNLNSELPKWGEHITTAKDTYEGCTSLEIDTIPNWNDSMTDISRCYYGCKLIGRAKGV